MLAVILLIACLDPLFAQVTEKDLEPQLTYMSRLDAGAYTLSSAEGLPFGMGVVRDTIQVIFAGLQTAADMAIISRDGNTISLYTNGVLYSIDSTRGTYYVDTVPRLELPGYQPLHPFNPVLTRGERIRALLARSISTTLTPDTLTSAGHYSTLRLTVPNAADSSDEPVRIEYLIRDSLIYGASDSFMWEGSKSFHYLHLLRYTFSDEQKAELERERQAILSKIRSGEYTPAPASTDSAPEERLLTAGKIAPDLTGLDTAGVKRSLSHLKADLYVLDFWFAGCQPCQKAMPMLERISNAYKGRVAVVGINANDDLPVIRNVMKVRKLSYLQLGCTPSVLESFGVVAFPTLYLLDSKRRVISTESGYSPETEKALTDTLSELLKSRH